MQKNMIRPEEITFVVQGAIDRANTPLCLQSLRRLFPGAEIILSTWEGSNTDGLICDNIILNEDPGGFQDKFCDTFVNNTLRQLVSTENGLNLATRKYAMKLRSDLIFRSADFLSHFFEFEKRDEKFSLFQQRVLVPSFFSKKYLYFNAQIQPVPFHITDWLAFGLLEDIKTLYCGIQPKEPEISWYLADHPYRTSKTDFLHCSHRYSPEQYIMVAAFRKKFKINFDHYLDYTNENILQSECLIANNFIILPTTAFRFYCGKERVRSDRYKYWSLHPSSIPKLLWEGLYRYDVFLNDYKKYCDPAYRIPQQVQRQSKWDKLKHLR